MSKKKKIYETTDINNPRLNIQKFGGKKKREGERKHMDTKVSRKYI